MAFRSLFLVGAIFACTGHCSSDYRDPPTASYRGGDTFDVETCSNDTADESAAEVLRDIQSCLFETQITDIDLCVPRGTEDIAKAVKDFSSPRSEEKGVMAWNFLRGLANSNTFVQKFWHKKPLLIRASDAGGWVSGSFTLERDLRLVDNSYITGFKTAEILRNGTKTDSWALSPLKEDPMRMTTWDEVKEALDGGTIYFNTAGSLWPNLGGLCRLTSYAFGLPPNVNVYVTPPGLELSVPPHTDRQDVLVFQTQGAKRWRVFAPPSRVKGKDPLNRGKSGDVLSFDEMGPPIIDTVLKTGDVLYVPTGFPHTTDTSTLVNGAGDATFEDTSVHLTMGLDTHVWCLTMAHLRWTLLQRCGLSFNLDIQDDAAYWSAMETVPFGFLGNEAWRKTVQNLKEGGEVDEELKRNVAADLKNILIELEPKRWKGAGGLGSTLPDDEKIFEVITYMVKSHWLSLMETQEELFNDIDPSDAETIVKAFRGTQEQNLIMEKFGEFSNNEAFAKSFAQRRIAAEQRTKGML